MTDQSKWALETAREVFQCGAVEADYYCRGTFKQTGLLCGDCLKCALALDAARRKALEEAETKLRDSLEAWQSAGHPCRQTVINQLIASIADLRALADREPS